MGAIAGFGKTVVGTLLGKKLFDKDKKPEEGGKSYTQDDMDEAIRKRRQRNAPTVNTALNEGSTLG